MRVSRNGKTLSGAVSSAAGIRYNNSGTPLTATTVQGAIDELSERVVFLSSQKEYDDIPTKIKSKNGKIYIVDDGNELTSAVNMGYDNSTTGMAATDVQAAIDELFKRIG